MAYEDVESSPHDGAPIECYEFVGTFFTYRFTSAAENVVLNGQTYISVPLKRKSVKTGTHNDDTLEMVLEIPYDNIMVQHYAYDTSPPELDLTVYRSHQSLNMAFDFVVYWQGPVTAFSVSGALCQLNIPGLFSTVLAAPFPVIHYQHPCNHVLFDSMCGISRASNSSVSTITAIGLDGYTISVLDDGAVDSSLRSGEVQLLASSERRLIVNNVADVVTLNYPFHTVTVGDSVEMTQGCDHSFATCKAKFSNSLKYGGFPNIPHNNPFKGKLHN